MSTVLNIYVLGNGDLYYQYFNAIVTSFGTSNYSTLVRLSLLIGGFITLFSLVLKRHVMELLKWFAYVYVTIYILFLPKVGVEIIDEVAGGKPYAVDHVPLGLALLANMTTSLGYALTQVTEMNFSMPNDLRYQKSGMVFASELVRATSQFEITDARFDGNMQGFIHQCVFYDILFKKYSINDLIESSNIWDLVSKNASPARAFIYTGADNHSEVTTCRDSIASLTNDWKQAVSTAKSLYSSRLFPNDPDPQNTLKKYLDSSYGYLTKLSIKADEIMQQSLMANAIQRGVVRMGATLNANAALQSYAYTRAQEQKRLTNQTVGDMAAYWLPLIKNDIELITYGSFIFVILLGVLPFGPATLKSFVYTSIWVQLWPPLYAILNLSISLYAQSKSAAATATGLSLQAMPGLLQINADMAGLAGYLSMSVPVLAGGLLWGMHHAFLQSSQYMGGVVQSTAGIGAAEAVTGNMGFGNTNFGNHSAFNTSANHVDTSSRVATGSSTMQLSDGSQLSVMPNSDQVLNMGNTIANLGASIGDSKTIRSGYTESVDKAITAAKSQNNAYHNASSVAMKNLYEIGSHMGEGESSGDSWNVSATAGTSQAFGNVKRITQNLADLLHKSYGETANLAANIYADGKAGLSFSGGKEGMGLAGSVSGSLGASRTATHSSSTDEGKSYSEAKDFLRDNHYSENVDIISRAAQDKSLRINNEKGARLVDNMGSSFDQAEGYRRELQSSLQQAESYRLQASRAEEDAFRIDAAAQNEFQSFIANHPGTDGKGKLGIDSVPHIMHDPELRDKFLKEFAGSYKTKIENNWDHGLSHSDQAIKNTYQKNNQHLPNASSIKSTSEHNNKQIQDRAEKIGLTSNHLIDHSIKKQVENTMVDHAKTVYEKNQSINQDGNAIQDKVHQEQSKKRHGGLIRDMTHDINTKDD